jgi:hypothetical protein
MGEQEIAYLVAMTENCNSQPATADELPDWQMELDFEAVVMTDPVREVYQQYADANGCEDTPPGGPGCSNAVSVLIDKQMRIRHFGPTYACGTGEGSQCGLYPNISDTTAMCIDETLTEIQALLAE